MPPRTLTGAPRLLSWASILEDKARDQVIEAANMPFVYPHAAGMADMHWGIGCPVGLVYPTVGAIVPGCVGVDIGCGMIAARTNLKFDELDPIDFREIRGKIEEYIPMSKGNYNKILFDHETEARVEGLQAMAGSEQANKMTGDGEKSWIYQLGSLGGGNHFIELCRDRLDDVWLFLHSGSRGVGNRLATKYIREAQDDCKRRWIKLPNPDLAYLVESDLVFWQYMEALRWAQEFALQNRREMLYRVQLAVQELYPQTAIEGTIQCHHNYTEPMPAELLDKYHGIEKRHSGTVWLSRKGAIDASPGTPGLIPGSMGAKSVIVRGKGSVTGLWSSPHGAGRLLGRRQANSQFSVQQLEETMKGIEWSHEIGGDLRDEIPYAYKPLHAVLEDSSDLVEIVNELSQFINVKGQ